MMTRWKVAVVAGAAGLIGGSASAQIEPLLWADGPIPGVPNETIWPTGLYRPAFSPDNSLFAIRVNASSANADEFIITGSGNTFFGPAVSTGDTIDNDPWDPNDDISVVFIGERNMTMNDFGEIAFTGSTRGPAQADAVFRYSPFDGITLIAADSETPIPSPFNTVRPNFVSVEGSQIDNFGNVAFVEFDSRSETSSSEFDGIFLFEEGQPSPTISGLEVELQNIPTGIPDFRFWENFNRPGSNFVPGAMYYYDTECFGPVLGIMGDLDGDTQTDRVLAVNGDVKAQELVTPVDDDFGVVPNTFVGKVEVDGTWWVGNSGGLFTAPPPSLLIRNGTVIGKEGELVPVDTIPGERWSSVFASDNDLGQAGFSSFDSNRIGGFVVIGFTDTAGLEEVMLYFDPAGNPHEIARKGDTIEVGVDGGTETRTILSFGRQWAFYAATATDSHVYFLAETDRETSSVNGGLFARVPLPCRSDFNGDESVNVADITDYLADLSSCAFPGCGNEFDGFCATDSFDLAGFLNEVGTCQ
ncbi:MAG: hypothetical protein AAGI30_07175 [Planctomycetota bacterium]